MTREEAESELMQLYGSLSEEKKKALDVAFKAMEQADNIPEMYYPQVDGITPTVVAQADGEYISKDKMLMFLNDMRYGIAPDETVADGDERREREAQVDVLDDLMEVVEQMPSVAIPSAEPKWIPCSERLPETDDDVLVCDGVDMFVAWYSWKGMRQGWNSTNNNFERNTPIEAWMPLPKPYEPQEGADR